MGDTIYRRICPVCGKELTTKNKYWNRTAINENRKCGSCTRKGKKFTNIHKKNLSKNHADFTGKNNPFFGKLHSVSSIKQMLDTRYNHPTWSENVKKGMLYAREFFFNEHGNPMDNPEYVHKIRIKRIEDIKNKNNGQLSPNYNKSSIPIIEQKAKELGITDLQHAENGGEYNIKELGYWVDGYSKDQNTVIEYYEKRHNKNKERDLRRQKEITDLLKCKFIIINE